MISLVVDNSVVMRWHLPAKSHEKPFEEYAEKVLSSASVGTLGVPWFWHVEAVSVLMKQERLGVVSAMENRAFLAQLARLDILTHTQLPNVHADPAWDLMRRHPKLSAYDACYLVLAIRQGVPLATNDQDLAEAAAAEGVPLYLGGPKRPKPGHKAAKKLK